METCEQERLRRTEHKSPSGDQRENAFQNGDLRCEKSQNTCLKIPFEGEQTELLGKRRRNVKDFKDIAVSGRTSSGQSPYRCDVCRKSFNSSSGLLHHQRSHRAKKRTYQCTQCGKSFPRVSALTQHQTVHREERVFECSNCGDRFTHSSSLILHKKTHEGEKPFVCPKCSQHFNRASELVAHLGSHT